MPSTTSIFSFASVLALASAHGVILNAQGLAGSPASVGFQVDPNIARNCTSINPCQQDTTIIRDAEIAANTVNECGRTELTGNIDIGENTENALSAGKVTQVQAGTPVSVTIHQVNADGAGPYACDMIEQGNNGVISQNLTVMNNVPGANGFSQAKTQDFNVTVMMPAKMTCTGGSSGNICTVRCRNNAQAGPFGGCFPVQQTDTTPNQNTPANIPTALAMDKVLKQVQQDQADLPAAMAANQVDGSIQQKAAAVKAQQLSGLAVTSKAAPVQTPVVALGGNGQQVAPVGAQGQVNSAPAPPAPAANGVTGRKQGGNKNSQRDMRHGARYVMQGKEWTPDQ